MAKVYLGLGTNLGDKEQNLRDAVQKIEEQVGKIVSLSAFYITAPWGFSSDNSFLNAAVCVDTELAPIDVLQRTQAIEQKLGRTKKSVNGIYSDRLIDIDLLLYDDLILSTTSPSGAKLILPHPLMAERDINFFPYSSYWVRQQDALKCILKVRMYFNLRHVSASAMLTKVELPKR